MKFLTDLVTLTAISKTDLHSSANIFYNRIIFSAFSVASSPVILSAAVAGNSDVGAVAWLIDSDVLTI